jgi:hypothetical protein
MTGARLWFCAVVVLVAAGVAHSAPKQSSTGEACIKTGSERRDGKDPNTGEKFNCLFDSCTYCGTSGGKIDCSILKTEYSNPTDCRKVASIRGQTGPLLNLPKMKAAPSK